MQNEVDNTGIKAIEEQDLNTVIANPNEQDKVSAFPQFTEEVKKTRGIDEFKNLKVSYVNDGKLDDQGVAMSNSDLTRTWTLVFTTNEDYEDFCAESAQSTYWNDLMSYNVSNSISHSLEADDI